MSAQFFGERLYVSLCDCLMGREGLISSGWLTFTGAFRKKEFLADHLDTCSLGPECSPYLKCKSAPVCVDSALMSDVRLSEYLFGQEKRSLRITFLCISDAWLGVQ